MKLLTRSILCLALILALCCPALASGITYEAGKTYTLTEEKIDLSGVSVYAPGYALSQFGLTSVDETGLVKVGTYEDFASSYALTLRYASDDFSTLMFEIGNQEGIACLRDGRLIVCFPNFARGAEDTYGVFAKIAQSPYLLSSQSGMTFSKDGRYALFIDSYQALSMARNEYQLIILDVEEGQYYLGYTWPVKMREGMEAVVGASFDEEGKSIFIKAYGNAYGENRNQLLRYHMETGKIELLSSHAYDVDYSNLFALPDGTYAHSYMPRSVNQPGGIIIYKESGDRWLAAANHFHTPTVQLRVRNMDVNRENGQASLLMSLAYKPYTQEDPEDSLPWPMLSAIALPVFNGGVQNVNNLVLFDESLAHASYVPVREYSSIASRMEASGKKLHDVLSIDLSPDGKYAFVVFLNADGAVSARILNTKTLDVSLILAEEGVLSRFASFGTGMSTNYRVAIQFIANDLIVINTENGVRLFRIS